MASRNHYVVLGVASSETDQGIRAAFRELAKRHHPDRAGPSGAVPFREITEAYEVLGDPRRRRAYDHRLRQLEEDRDRAEPSAPELVRELSFRRDLEAVRPSAEEIFRRFARNFTHVGVPKGERPLELGVDVALSTEEAARGAHVRLRVPVAIPCARCRGRGCVACDGHGSSMDERPVIIHVPPMTGTGATFVVPLTGFGIHNFFLGVRVRIDPTLGPPAG